MISQFQEEMEIEFNSRYDYIREFNAGMEEDPRTLELEMRGRWEDDTIEMQDEMEARGGPVFHVTSFDDEIFF